MSSVTADVAASADVPSLGAPPAARGPHAGPPASSRDGSRASGVSAVAASTARRRRRLMWAPLATLVLLIVFLLEGPRLLRASGIAPLLPSWPIESVSVAGDLHQVSRPELTTAITEVLDSDFFAVDVAAIRAVALAVPWVEEVSVRKVWPGRLHVSVRERHAVARWGAGGLLADTGRHFDPGAGKGLDQLPLLSGPTGSEASVLGRYRALVGKLEPLGSPVVGLTLDPPSGWHVDFASGLTLVLGHDMDDAAVARFAESLPTMLGERFGDAERVDLRYTNGFAVRWRPNTAPEENRS